jgi:hypothetical protein
MPYSQHTHPHAMKTRGSRSETAVEWGARTLWRKVTNIPPFYYSKGESEGLKERDDTDNNKKVPCQLLLLRDEVQHLRSVWGRSRV